MPHFSFFRLSPYFPLTTSLSYNHFHVALPQLYIFFLFICPFLLLPFSYHCLFHPPSLSCVSRAGPVANLGAFNWRPEVRFCVIASRPISERTCSLTVNLTHVSVTSWYLFGFYISRETIALLAGAFQLQESSQPTYVFKSWFRIPHMVYPHFCVMLCYAAWPRIQGPKPLVEYELENHGSQGRTLNWL